MKTLDDAAIEREEVGVLRVRSSFRISGGEGLDELVILTETGRAGDAGRAQGVSRSHGVVTRVAGHLGLGSTEEWRLHRSLHRRATSCHSGADEHLHLDNERLAAACIRK